jgi:hypothetical protein
MRGREANGPIGSPISYATKTLWLPPTFSNVTFRRRLNARGVLARVPTHPVSLRFIAASLVHLGKPDEAHAAIQKLLQAYPDMTISRVRSHFRHPWMTELYLDALRAAGLPE